MAETGACRECGVKFLLDECLSHLYVATLAIRGYPDAIHPIHIGMRRSRDDQLLARAIAEDRILISANARDYRKLLRTAEIHPGAILVEGVDRMVTWRLIELALSFIETQFAPNDYMINRVVEVTRMDGVRPYVLPIGGIV